MSIIAKSIAIATIAVAGLLGTPAHAATEGFNSAPLALFAAAPLEGKLNINDATLEQWELLPGVGPVTAERIVQYASKHPFADPLHLLRVKGIGRKTYAKLKPFLTLDGPTTLREAK